MGKVEKLKCVKGVSEKQSFSFFQVLLHQNKRKKGYRSKVPSFEIKIICMEPKKGLEFSQCIGILCNLMTE